MPEYKIIIESKDEELEGSLNPRDVDKSTNEKLKPPSKKDPDREDTSSLIAPVQKIGSAIAAIKLVTEPFVQHATTTHQIQGETLKAQRLSTTYNNISQNVDLGLQVVSDVTIAIATKNPILLARTALSIAQRAIGLAQEVRRYNVQRNIDL